MNLTVQGNGWVAEVNFFWVTVGDYQWNFIGGKGPVPSDVRILLTKNRTQDYATVIALVDNLFGEMGAEPVTTEVIEKIKTAVTANKPIAVTNISLKDKALDMLKDISIRQDFALFLGEIIRSKDPKEFLIAKYKNGINRAWIADIYPEVKTIIKE